MFKFIFVGDSILLSRDGHQVLSIVKILYETTSIMYHPSKDPADNEGEFSALYAGKQGFRPGSGQPTKTASQGTPPTKNRKLLGFDQQFFDEASNFIFDV